MSQQTPKPIPKPSSSSATLTTILGLLIFIIAFFPHQFAYLIRAPLGLSTSPSSSRNTNTNTHTSDCCTACASPTHTSMSFSQTTFSLASRSRGSYLITSEVEKAVPEIKNYKVGLLNLFMQHTSAALSLNENWDEDVRADMSDALDRIAPEDRRGDLYRHAAEGPDDMPAHIKSALIGASVTIPIKDGKLATGTWQGIWYLEFRASKHSRKVVATIQGEKK